MNQFEKPNGLEKVIRWIFPIGGVLLGMKFFTSHIAPFFTSFFDSVNGFFGSALGAFGSFLAFVVVVAPFAFLFLYFYNRPHMLSNIYLGLCRSLTRAIIKHDPLGHMDSYLERFQQSHLELKETIKSVDAKRIEMEREYEASSASFKKNMDTASAAKQVALKHSPNSETHVENMQLAAHHASMAESDRENVEKYKPTYELIKKQLVILNKVEGKWKFDIKELEYDIKNKRRQYETLKKTAAAAQKAQEFINGNSKEAKDFQMSVSILEEKITTKFAAIEQFQKDSKMIMQTFDLQQAMNESEGMKLLEQYEQNGNSILFGEKTVDANAQVLGSRPLNSEFSTLLSKKTN
jgi:ABC-type multidrug transport system fused ATPase/permease subunit